MCRHVELFGDSALLHLFVQRFVLYLFKVCLTVDGLSAVYLRGIELHLFDFLTVAAARMLVLHFHRLRL